MLLNLLSLVSLRISVRDINNSYLHVKGQVVIIVFQITAYIFNYVVSDSSTELKTKKVSSSRANYSIMFVKSLLMPFQFFKLNFKLENMSLRYT